MRGILPQNHFLDRLRLFVMAKSLYLVIFGDYKDDPTGRIE